MCLWENEAGHEDLLMGIIAEVKHHGDADGIVVYSRADFLEQRFEQNTTAYIDAINRALYS